MQKMSSVLWLSALMVIAHCSKTGPIRKDVSLMLVKTLQNQLQTCMDQNAELVKRTCNGGNNNTNNIGSPNRHSIAFHAGLSKDVQDLPHNYKLIFDRVYLNEGKAYDPHTGVFTCQKDGIFVFHWTIFTLAGKYFYTDYMLNGKVAGRSHLIASTTNRAASSSVVLKLKKGDKTWIEPHGSYTGQRANAGWSFYSGYSL